MALPGGRLNSAAVHTHLGGAGVTQTIGFCPAINRKTDGEQVENEVATQSTKARSLPRRGPPRSAVSGLLLMMMWSVDDANAVSDYEKGHQDLDSLRRGWLQRNKSTSAPNEPASGSPHAP